jgi:hypothetical protein
MNKTIIIGGGTIEKMKEHLALCAPAYGKVASTLHHLIPNSELLLTRMADSTSELESSNDILELINELLEDVEVKTIIMSAAICDFTGNVLLRGSGRPYYEKKRLDSKLDKDKVVIHLTPTEKIIKHIRVQRPDIFLVAFKTTVGATEDEQFKIGVKMMKENKCNIVLANDTETWNNIIIVPEENYYETHDRTHAIEQLANIITLREKLTYKSSKWIGGDNMPSDHIDDTFKTVLTHCIDNGAYPLNQNGFTVGHFGYKVGPDPTTYLILSSQRKGNHNTIFDTGFTCITMKSGELSHSTGEKKASVGATSQKLLFDSYPEYNCIIHFHGKLKPESHISKREQWAFQCGSEECSQNTLDGIEDYDGIKAVHLVKHGPNIIFKSSDDPYKIIKFINDNWLFGELD